MSEKETQIEEQNRPRPWQPTNTQVFWVIGVGVALEALALLVVELYPGIWEDLSQERVAVSIGIGVSLTVVVVLVVLAGSSIGWTGFGERKLWDWLQLLSTLAIPVVLAVGGYL